MPRFFNWPIVAAAIGLLVVALPASAEVPKVVVSIKPLHSLVAGVMQGAGEPLLLLDGAQTPHSYALKPTDATALQEADVVFWIGEGLEGFLQKPLQTLSSSARVVEIMELDGLTLLPTRTGEAFEAHAHHDEGKHDDHGHGKDHKHDDHKHDSHNEAKHKHDDHKHDHAGHEDSGMDSHLWLDPQNALVIVQQIAEQLSELDAPNAALYGQNSQKLQAEITALDAEISAQMAGLSEKPFIVFHDGYQYFENRYGLAATAAITLNPDVMPGAKRLKELQDKVKASGAKCVFAEPQFDDRIVQTVLEGATAHQAVLDPLGATLDNGAELYSQLMGQMALAFKTCLSGE